MKKSWIILVVLIFTFIAVFSLLTACNNGNSPESETPSTDDPSTTPSEEQPSDPSDDEPSWTTDEYDAIVAQMGLTQNYTYTNYVDGSTNIYRIVGDSVDFRLDGNNRSTIWYVENNVSYQLKYESDKYYHKTVIDNFDVNSFIYNDMADATITEYDEETQQYTITMGGVTYSMQISTDKIELFSSLSAITIEDIDNTTFPFPNEWDIRDDTKTPDEPNPPVVDPDEPDVEEKIYALGDKGERIYNSKLLGETVKEILNTEDATGKNKITELLQGDDFKVTVEKVLFVSTEGEYIQIGTILLVHENNVSVIDIIKISHSTVSQLNSDKQSWVVELSSATASKININDMMRFNYSESIEASHQEDLKRIMEMALDRIAVHGVQSHGITVEGTPEPRYANSQVLAVFEADNGMDGKAGLGLGYVSSKTLAGTIIDGNGTLMYVVIHVATSERLGETLEERILGGADFIVFNMEKNQEIDKQFFETDEATSVQNLLRNSVALPEKKGKEYGF